MSVVDHARQPFPEETLRILGERGMTQKTLAIAAGIDRSYLSRALRGLEPPSLDMIERVTGALDLPEAYFAEVQRARIGRHLEGSLADTWVIYKRWFEQTKRRS